MFLHSGASLHGHEYNTPPGPHSPQRKKPFLRSAIPPPILRSSSSADRPPLPPSRPSVRRRPVSELYVRPKSDFLPAVVESTQSSAPPTPVVRFKDLDVEETPTSSSTTTTRFPSFMTEEEEDRSLCESDDVSQTTASTPRRKSRRASPRNSTAYLLAQPAPSSVSKKALFKTIRPKLLLQLQELAPNHRPRPTVDVFPACLIAGPLVAARYFHRSPRLFGDKGELGPRDVILVRSDDYTAGSEEEEDDSCASRRHPIAVLRPGRGPADMGEVVLENGNRWTWTNQKGNYSFTHIDEHGVSCTVRWVKRSAATNNRESSIFIPGASGPSFPPSSPPLGSDSTSSDYRYTFSIINPLVRRHPVLATLGPQSLEIYDSYSTPSSSSGKYPPSRPVSGAWDAAVRDVSSAAPIPLEGSTTGRETYAVDEKTKELIRITALCLTLRLGPNGEIIDNIPESQFNAHESATNITSSRRSTTIMPRRQTTGNMATATAAASASAVQPPQPKGLRRAMSTGAAFMMQRKKRLQEAPSTCSMVSERYTAETAPTSGKRPEATVNTPQVAEERINPTAGSAATVQQKQARRISWLRKLTH